MGRGPVLWLLHGTGAASHSWRALVPRLAPSFTLVVPDLPGCFSAGDTLEEAMIQAEEAITAWVEVTIDAGESIPKPSGIESLRAAHPEFDGWLWALVKVDPAMLDDTLERVNISLPRRVLHRLDDLARRAGETRSGFIARMAIEGRKPTEHC